MKKLTERQAWLAVARAFKHCPHSLLERRGLAKFGLCHAKDLLLERGSITFSTYYSMQSRIRMSKPTFSFGAYHWPLEDKRARELAARNFAQLCSQ